MACVKLYWSVYAESLIFAVLFLKMQTLSVNTITCCHKPIHQVSCKRYVRTRFYTYFLLLFTVITESALPARLLRQSDSALRCHDDHGRVGVRHRRRLRVQPQGVHHRKTSRLQLMTDGPEGWLPGSCTVQGWHPSWELPAGETVTRAGAYL